MRGAQDAARWRSWMTARIATPQLAHVVEDAEEVELVAHVEVRRRLVEEEHGRLLREPARESGELPLAGRERPERPPREVLDLRLPERARDRRPVLRGERRERPAVRVAAERHPVLDRDAVRRLVLRGHEGHALREARARPARERASLEEDLAPRGRAEGPRARARGSTCRPRSGPTRARPSPGWSARSTPRSTFRRPRSTAEPAGLENGAHPRPSCPRSARRK